MQKMACSQFDDDTDNRSPCHALIWRMRITVGFNSMLHHDHHRLALCLPPALQGAKGGRRDSFKRLDKQASHQSLNGLAEESAASSASLQTNTEERKDLLARLQGPQQTRGDLDQLLAAAAKVLQDAGTLCTSAVLPFATFGLERRYTLQAAAMQLQLKNSVLHGQHG